MSIQSELGKLAFTIGKEVADNVGKKAIPVAEKAAKKIEDWVFKKKPNEISGTEYINYYKDRNKALDESSNKLAELVKQSNDKSFRNQWKKQLENDPILAARPSNAARTFARLEDANMPRKYTGKVAKGLLKNNTVEQDIRNMGSPEKALSRGLKDMNESQRETLITLLPEWDFTSMTIDDLIQAAKNL